MHCEVPLQSLNLFRRSIIMRSSCCILFVISLLTISVADDPHDKVPDCCNVVYLKNVSSAVKDANEIIRSKRGSLHANMTRVKKNLNFIKDYTRGKIKAKGRRLKKVINNKKLPSSCVEALKGGKPSGVYRLHIPPYNLAPFKAYCLEDPGKGPAYTVLQRRQDGSVDFYRDWDSYENGFGDPNGELWIGLNKIYAMTSHRSHSLWIHLEDFKINIKFAKYDKFAISGPRENYTLSTLGRYRGSAGDSLTHHLNMQFSTRDRDNDEAPCKNCAIANKGGWWYRNCYLSHLNGPYGQYPNGRNIAWHTWAYYFPLRYSRMAIQPIY